MEPFKDTIILFDEPELSLSIEWQRKLLPDILIRINVHFYLLQHILRLFMKMNLILILLIWELYYGDIMDVQIRIYSKSETKLYNSIYEIYKKI